MLEMTIARKMDKTVTRPATRSLLGVISIVVNAAPRLPG